MGSRMPLAAAVIAVLAVLLVPAAAQAKVVWLCKPGQRANPCEPSLTTTNLSPNGKRLGVERVQRAKPRRADCFYVYPTVSDQKQPPEVVDDVLRSVALYQAARYSRDCRVFAPSTGRSRSRAFSTPRRSRTRCASRATPTWSRPGALT
jgi:hypothetical protein